MKSKNNVPTGIILFLILIGFSIFSIFFIMLTKKHMVEFGPFFMNGIVAIIFYLISLSVLSMIFFGTLERYEWARKLAIFWFALTLFIQLINLITFLVDEKRVMVFYHSLFPNLSSSAVFGSLLWNLVFSGGIDVLIIWYLVKVKDYFKKAY